MSGKSIPLKKCQGIVRESWSHFAMSGESDLFSLTSIMNVMFVLLAKGMLRRYRRRELKIFFARSAHVFKVSFLLHE